MLEYNGPIVGIALKQIVTRALKIAKQCRSSFKVSHKPGYKPNTDDIFTTVDTSIQDMYIKLLSECFPGFGIVGEEGCKKNPHAEIYFVVDPLDGTTAYTKRWSRGAGTMVALVDRGKIVSVYIGDVNTGEIYGYRPGSNNVWRFQSEFEDPENLALLTHKTKLKDVQLLSQRSESQLTPHCLALVNQFESLGVERGSIGLLFTRLWKREVGAVLIQTQCQTPWDNNPILGMSEKLGYRYYKHCNDVKCWIPCFTGAIRDITDVNHEILVIHPSLARELN
jgi:fructose-1,6-bisphosphatase/inositol monophosphatase family enzyme